MRPDPPPAITWFAAALIAGAACGHDRVRWALLAIGIAGLAALVPRARRVAAPALLLLAGWCVGAVAQRAAWHGQQQRLERMFGDARRVESEVLGRVVAAPERRVDGSRTLILDALVPPHATAARVRLEVMPPPPDDPSRLTSLRRGDVVVVWCALRAPVAGPGVSLAEARRRLAAQRIDADGRVKSARLVRTLRRGDPSPERLLDALHVAAVARMDRALGAESRARAVLGAMVLGDRGLLTEDVEGLLRDSGLVHLISISGMHTAMTMLALLALFRGVGIRPAGLVLASALALPALAALVGHGAPVWRACSSVAVALLARAAGREVDALGALALAAGTLVLASPGLAWNVGFLLSVLATAGLIACMRCGRPRAGPVARGLAASLGAYLATVPMLARVFGRLAPSGLVTNLVAAPLCGACLGSGIAVIVAGDGVPIVSKAAAWAGQRAVDALLETSRLGAAIPGGHFRVAAPSPFLLAAYVATLLAVVLGRGFLPVPARRLVGCAAAIVAIAIHLGPAPPGRGPARVEVLNVGQGLAVVLRGPSGASSLYDAGPGPASRRDAGDRIVVPALAAAGVRRLEVLALSHDHDDHAGGAFAVLRDREVGELWLAAGSERDPLTARLAAAAVARGTAVRRVRRGMVCKVGGLSFDVLHPGRSDDRRAVNDRCLTVRARTVGGASIVLPGDLEAEGERALLDAGMVPSADALVAPHHGSDGSGTPAFVAAVGARHVVISVGAGNRFGHPGPAALAGYRASGARLLRTDRDGTVVLDESRGAWRVSVEDDRGRDEREEEHRGQEQGDGVSARPERLAIVRQSRMSRPEEQEDDEPQGVRRRHAHGDRVNDDPEAQREDRRPGHEVMRPRGDGEEGVPAVELAHGEEVHRRHQHADPCGSVDRADLQVRGVVEDPLEDRRDQGRAERGAVADLGRQLGGASDADDENRQRDDEPRDRPRGRDVEERSTRRDRPPDADDRSERPDEHRGPGQEEGERGPHAITAAGQVVPHLVGPQDQQEEGRVRDPPREPAQGKELAPAGVRCERALPEPAPRRAGGQERGREKRRVNEEPWAIARPAGRRRGSGDLVAHRPSIVQDMLDSMGDARTRKPTLHPGRNRGMKVAGKEDRRLP
jgi:competence protein ComEC